LYITGRGGDHTKGLGGYLSTLVTDYHGVSVDVPFLKKDIDQQIKIIRNAISDRFVGTVIANSYGAYLTLLSLIDFDHQLDQVVLLSPVLGRAIAKDRMYFSRPPATARLDKALKTRSINFPKNTSIYIGDDDELFDSELLSKYSEIIGEQRVFVLHGQKHNIDQNVMQDILKTVLQL
jgi:hypothetical protein